MGVRGMYDQELSRLKDDIFSMGEAVVEAFQEALHLLKHRDKEKMNEMVSRDATINKRELEIHDRATLMIARQQPVATDLRTTIVALKISSDLERVGDLAVDMVKATMRLNEEDYQIEIHELESMADVAVKMLNEALTAYQKQDLMRAQHIALLDDKVDKKYAQYIKELFTSSDKNNIGQATQLAFIGRYIERIADYATNLAEWIVYERNGKHFDLN
ncbi:phosphate uptake regulator, PhoU [Alteribacillus persepolensis]|uniref:Phosphate-specific transport system accessory protein PhoU n=1 Tax=Alteribacillus persepolensis TaxID=568899 RepID=A0A1G8GMI0_9BACI|nr:phosphate signaling complex protein PhoU [Alteribacillus persepolensis]SDH95516.1 phosphate uptake regulator, PhoU [Alteribacillus persepolensis]